MKLARARHGWTLPDDVHGRCMLRGFVAVGATDRESRTWAPWASDGELRALVAEVDALPWAHWTPDRLGRLVELTDDEREAEKLTALMPCDLDRHIIRSRVHERRRQRDRERVREKRRDRRMWLDTAYDVDDRAESVLAALHALGDGWVPVSRLVDAVRGGRAWRTLSEASLRKVVHRAVDELVDIGRAESRVEGAFRVRLVRLRNAAESRPKPLVHV